MSTSHPLITKSRLEAFSDGVIAVIITIMVLELKVPQGAELAALKPLLPLFLSYLLSFIFVGIYWNNHHHMLQTAEFVNGRIMWANLHFLFWLSLTPFTTAWLGENLAAPIPVAVYGVVLLGSAIAYTLLALALIARHGHKSVLAAALGSDFKGKASMVIYAVAIALAFVTPWISCALYVAVAAIWFIPDPRIEKALEQQ
jgi:uncharacterized membrane protein